MRRLSVAILLVPVLAACGGERSDVGQGVAAINRALAPQGVRLDCPDEVDGGKGTEFDCTLKGVRTGRGMPVRMRIVEEGSGLAVDFAGDREAVQSAIRRTSGG